MRGRNSRLRRWVRILQRSRVKTLELARDADRNASPLAMALSLAKIAKCALRETEREREGGREHLMNISSQVA